jgi:acetyltransferase
LLAGYRDRPAADLAALCRVLVQVSQMVIDLPELVELDINPLLTGETGVLALDARVSVRATTASGSERLAIRPYPRELEETVAWGEQDLVLRPIRPDDEPRHLAFLQKLDPEDIRMRIFSSRRVLERSELARLTQIDYEREMAFIALAPGADGALTTVGTVRAVTDPDNDDAEFGIIVRSDLKRRGLGHLLLNKMIRYCRDRGTQRLVGDVLAVNTGMLQLAGALGFQSTHTEEGELVRIALPLQSAK